MKLAMEGFIPCKYLGYREGLKMIRDAGFDAVDFSMYFLHEIENMLDDNFRQTAHGIRSILDELHLPCCQAHAPFTLCVDDNFDEGNPAFAEVVRSLEFTAILGAPHIVVHGPVGSSDPTSAEYEELIYSYFKALEPYCKKFGIKIAVENLRGAGCRTPDAHSRLLRRLDSKWFTGLIDLGHANLVGYTPAEFLRLCDRGTIHGLHVHDNFGINDDHLNPFSGSIDWADAMHALAEIGYDGPIIMEPYLKLIKSGEALLRSIAFMRDKMKE